MALRFSAPAAVVLGLIAVAAPLQDAGAAALDWRVCLKTRTGTFIDINDKDSYIYARLKKCTGNAIFTIRDLDGGALMGEDKIRLGNAGLQRRWFISQNSKELVQYVSSANVGSPEYFNIHRADRKKQAIASGDRVALNGNTGWVYDNNGGKFKASSGQIGAGETFTIVFPDAKNAGTDAGSAAALKKAQVALKARAPKAPKATFSRDGEIHYGDKVVLSTGGRYLTADLVGRVSAKKVNPAGATVFEVYDPKGGKANKRQISLYKDHVALRVAGTHRWLSASDKEDAGRVYKMVPLNWDIYNFSDAEAGPNGGLNSVVIMRPRTPRGWVWIGDSVFRYRESGAKDVYPNKMYSIIFKDNKKYFKKPKSWVFNWASGNRSPRNAIVAAGRLSSPFNQLVGGHFFAPWCCKGLENARLIHRDYALRNPPTGDDFFSTATGQWTSRYQKFGREGTAIVYNAAAFTYLADGKLLPMMVGAAWGFPLGCGAECGWGKGKSGFHPAGNVNFLNKKFIDDFSYYAAPRQLRARPGASGGKKPAKPKFSEIVLYHHNYKAWSKIEPLLTGMPFRMGSNGRNSNVDGNGTVRFNDKCFSCSPEWRMTKLNKSATRRVDIESKWTGRGVQLTATGPGAVPASLARYWQPYIGQAKEYANPRVTQEGDLFVLEGLIKGNNKFGRVLKLPRVARPSGTLIFNANNHTRSARVNVTVDGQVTWTAGGGTHGGWLSLSGITFTTKKGKALSLVNGWRPYGKGFAAPTAAKTGNVVALSGMILGGKYGHLANLPGGFAPPGRLVFSVNHHDKQSQIKVFPNGQIHWAAGGRKHGWVSLSGITYSVKPGANIPLIGTWKPLGQRYAGPQMSKEGNIVILSGIITGTKVRPAHMATLPAGYRPSKRLVFNVNAGAEPARVDVFSNGVVRVEVGGTRHGWVSLSGINFSVR